MDCYWKFIKDLEQVVKMRNYLSNSFYLYGNASPVGLIDTRGKKFRMIGKLNGIEYATRI